VQRHLGRTDPTGRRGPVAVSARRPHRTVLAGATVLLALVLALGVSGRAVAAKGDASSAAGFLEDAQNDDGGFGPQKGQPSEPVPSLWASVGLLAAGRNPLDEYNKGGDSLDGYLADHAKTYTSLEQRGLLALVAGASGVADAHFGAPAARLRDTLTAAATKADPRGAALAVLGLLATGDDASEQTATAGAQALLGDALADGGWGRDSSSDSAATALALQAIAKAGVTGADAAPVQAGIAYLAKAQGNDGAIAVSIRTDQAVNGGDVGATAFALQAFAALGVAAPKTATGKTLRDGLTQYQQQTTGGLSSAGSLYDTSFAPSVVETAQAFPAFNGDTFPLAAVPAATSGPPKATQKSAESKSTKKSRHVSSGTAATGVSGAAPSTAADRGAFHQARAGRTGKGAPGKADRKGGAARKPAAKSKSSTSAAGGGTPVSGQVVGATAAPKLVARAGQEPSALSDQDRATIGLGVLLVLLLAAGAVASARHPRADERSRVQRALIAATRLLVRARARGSLVPAAVAITGALLVAVPFATHLWERAPRGEALISAYAPYMKPERVAGYQRDLRQLDAGVREATSKGPKALYPDRGPVAARAAFDRHGPMLAGFARQWPDTYKSLSVVVDPIAAHREGYAAIAALPRFGLFSWAFVVPGAALLLLAALALAWPRSWRATRWAVAAVALGLLVAPSALHLWERAPQGAALVDAFGTIETRATVVRVQNDFGQVAIAQGALGGELVPALQRHGLSDREIDARFPAVRTLTTRWIAILNDLTPVIGALSDNVDRFQAVAALPPLTAFPWLFVAPGALLAALLAAGALRPVLRPRPRPALKEHHVPSPTR
jgi:hypothetical protein